MLFNRAKFGLPKGGGGNPEKWEYPTFHETVEKKLLTSMNTDG
jgi:hypothetical protein